MINSLLIKNYAIIEELEIDFSDRLTIITGETGAGKSILLGALGLIMGKRADTKSLYNEEKKCIIEGHFRIGHYELQSFFDEHELDYEDELVVRREITPSGKSRAFINDTPVNLKMLQQLSGSLIDLHQQFDTLDIHNVSFQLRMIDALADNQKLLRSYQQAYRQYQKDKKQLQQLIEQSNKASQEIDFLSFQLEEFNKVELFDGEQEKLEEEQSKLNNAEDIKKLMSAAFQHLSEDEQSIVNQMNELSISISKLTKVHSGIAKLYERFEGTRLELQDLAAEFESLAHETEYDQGRLSDIQERLDLIYKLENKHRVNTVQELIQIQADLQNRLGAYGDMSGEIERLEAVIEKHEKNLTKVAKQLSTRRKGVVSNFEKKVHHLLGQLSMEHARLQVQINPLEELNATGSDNVEFLFAPNLGSKFLPIKNVASGGEISRLTLCTKSLVASAIPLPTLIFDEIDTGISGDVALKMGNILHSLSNQHQVISITHTPQIAVKADRHYFVYKSIKENKTVTAVRRLAHEERVKAVATMLSGSPPSPSAIENAKELLAQ